MNKLLKKSAKYQSLNEVIKEHITKSKDNVNQYTAKQGWATVVFKKSYGYFVLVDKDGNEIPGQLDMEISDPIDGFASATVTLMIDRSAIKVID